MTSIKLRNISKNYYVREKQEGKFSGFKTFLNNKKRTIKALENISFEIAQGELVGYIGPNGAGKSTTVKIMSGILTPDSGECEIFGLTPWKNRIKHVSNIGVVFGQRSQLWWDLAVDDSFIMLKDIYKIPNVEYKQRKEELYRILDIENLVLTPVRQLSLGQRMRCEIAASLIHRPQILFLDEPTIGLDAVSKINLREFLKQENKKYGTTMILTTHDMTDIEALCDRVMVIGKGELLYDGAFTDLKRKYSQLKCIVAHTDNFTDDFYLPQAEEIQINETCIKAWYNPQKIKANKIIELISEKIDIKDIDIKEKEIDEIIMLMYKEMSI